MSAAWQGSTRAKRLPKNWHKLRARVLRRDGHHCTTCGSLERLEVHHLGDGNDHRDQNLSTLCHDCHQRETQAEAAQARAAQPKLTTRRPPEQHPGLR